MKILMMNDLSTKSKQGSGAERFVGYLSNGLIQAGFEVDVQTFFPMPPEPSIIADYDIVHFHNFSMMPKAFQRALIDRTVKTPVPKIFTVHDYTYFCRRRHGLNDKAYPCAFLGQDRNLCAHCAPFATSIEEGLLDVADVIVADSVNMADIFKKHLPNAQDICAVLLGMPVMDFKTETKHRNTFLYMGRHSFEKGVTEMIAAFKGVHAKQPNTRLVLTHTGRDSEVMRLQIKRAGLEDAVTMTGKITRREQEKHISDCLAVLAPSIWEEPFNLTITEAWSHHRPVIASRIGSHPELINRSNGGILYDTYDISEFTDAMLDLYRNQARADWLGENGNKAITSFFNQKRVVDNYAAIYDRLVTLRILKEMRK